MNAPRVVLVTRRFWPLVGGAETAIAHLARQLAAAGAHATIVTPQWDPTWNREFAWRGADVVRLPYAPQGSWGLVRYLTALGAWLRSRRDRYDLLCVSMLRYDAYAALVAASRRATPIVLRAEAAGSSGDVAWQATAPFGQRVRRRCQQADAIVAPSDAVANELLAAGYAAQWVHRIDNAAGEHLPRTRDRRSAAREALGAMYGALAIDDRSPLAVSLARLDDPRHFEPLLRGWRRALRRRPEARLWLAGEGAGRLDVLRLIDRLGLAAQVLVPGSFDDVEDLLHAADLLIHPHDSHGESAAMAEAAAVGLPIVAVDTPGNRMYVAEGVTGRLVAADEAAAWTDVLVELWQVNDVAAAFPAAERLALDRATANPARPTMGEQHLALFRQLMAGAGPSTA